MHLCILYYILLYWKVIMYQNKLLILKVYISQYNNDLLSSEAINKAVVIIKARYVTTQIPAFIIHSACS